MTTDPTTDPTAEPTDPYAFGPVTATPIRHQVSAFGPTDSRSRYYSVYIELRGDGRFAVAEDHMSPCRYVTAAGEWKYRSDDDPTWRTKVEHDWDTAVALATVKATELAHRWAQEARLRHAARERMKKPLKDWTRPELIAECRRLGVTPRGGLTKANRADLEMWVSVNQRS